MRYRVHTASGSMYLIDDETKTWKRSNNNLGHEEIRGYDKDGGTFIGTFEVKIGQSMYIDLPGGMWIRTTAVVRIELLDEV